MRNDVAETRRWRLGSICSSRRRRCGWRARSATPTGVWSRASAPCSRRVSCGCCGTWRCRAWWSRTAATLAPWAAGADASRRSRRARGALRAGDRHAAARRDPGGDRAPPRARAATAACDDVDRRGRIVTMPGTDERARRADHQGEVPLGGQPPSHAADAAEAARAGRDRARGSRDQLRERRRADRGRPVAHLAGAAARELGLLQRAGQRQSGEPGAGDARHRRHPQRDPLDRRARHEERRRTAGILGALARVRRRGRSDRQGDRPRAIPRRSPPPACCTISARSCSTSSCPTPSCTSSRRAADTGRTFLEVEREELGTDHGEIAGWLVEKWRFPACLAEPITWHHAPSRARVARDETAIVHVANALVRALGYGSGGDRRLAPIDPTAWARLALTPDTLDAILERFDADLDHALNYATFE